MVLLGLSGRCLVRGAGMRAQCCEPHPGQPLIHLAVLAPHWCWDELLNTRVSGGQLEGSWRAAGASAPSTGSGCITWGRGCSLLWAYVVQAALEQLPAGYRGFAPGATPFSEPLFLLKQVVGARLGPGLPSCLPNPSPNTETSLAPSTASTTCLNSIRGM